MKQQHRILIVEDDAHLRELFATTLNHAGFDAHTARQGAEALRLFYALQPDLVVLDILMPGMDGWAVLQRLRELSDTPVLVLSSLSADADIIQGLRAGADGFLTKPVAMAVLVEHVHALLRRAKTPPMTKKSADYQDDHLLVDLFHRRVVVDGEPVKLLPKEFDILAYLVRNAGRIVATGEILEQVWGWEYIEHRDFVHQYVSRLRRKIEPEAARPRYVMTEYGVGYRFLGKG